MPSFAEVSEYLELHQLEEELSEAVAQCVEESQPQPLHKIADIFQTRARELAVQWDYGALKAELRTLVSEQKCGSMLMKLSFHDAATFSAAEGDGGPNAALRHPDAGEGTWPANDGLAEAALTLLEPLKARHPNISRADLWAFAANVALEAMGGPAVLTRFGRRDAASSVESVESPDGRLVDEGALGIERKAAYLRRVYRHKGFCDREIVALQVRCALSGGIAASAPRLRQAGSTDSVPCACARVRAWHVA